MQVRVCRAGWLSTKHDKLIANVDVQFISASSLVRGI